MALPMPTRFTGEQLLEDWLTSSSSGGKMSTGWGDPAKQRGKKKETVWKKYPGGGVC